MEVANISKYGLIQWEYENPQQIEAFWFEKVDGNELRYWSKNNLPTCGIICSIYFIFIWLGPKWMKNRKPFNLDRPLAIWNFFLSLFSLIVVIRMTPPLVGSLMQQDGYYRSTCLSEQWNYPTTFWSFLFIISKVAELGDTVFIVLRKRPVIFLHGFHHFNMVWSSFFIYVEGEPMIRFVVIVNSFVHTIMYAYFGLRALHIEVPKRTALVITSLQILQFVSGLIGQCHQLTHYGGNGRPCIRTQNSIIVMTTFGFAYLFLFVRLFYNAYILNRKQKMV